MTAEQEIFLLNQTIKEIEEQKTLLYIKDGFEKIKLVNEKAGRDSCEVFYVIQKLKDNTDARIIMIEHTSSQRADKLRTVLPIYDIAHLVNGKAFANALSLAPIEGFTINTNITFDDFMQNAVLSDYSKLHVRNKLENNLEDKPSTKQLKI